ncbi:MAG: fasciclin domain-containing protein [Acidimicrobiales bacterium]|nr:fasciclin domain-containing protein [Acidimicrobiales bacterium]
MRNRPTPTSIIVGASLLAMSLAACGSTEEAVDDATGTASSVVEEVDAGEEMSDAGDEMTDLSEQLTAADLEAAIGDADVSTLFTVLGIAGFDDVADADAFTLFAPNDSAFAALDQELLTELLADPDRLRDILQDHLLDEVVMAGDLPSEGTVTANGGLELQFDLSGDQPTVNGIPILRTDVTVGDRGVVHVIDGLLLEE